MWLFSNTGFSLSLKNARLGPFLTPLNLHLIETLMSLKICNIYTPANFPPQTLWGGRYTVFMLSVHPCVRLCVHPRCWFFPNTLKTHQYSSISADTLISIRCTYIRESKGQEPILLELLPFVNFFLNAVKSLCAHYLFNQWLEFDQTSTDTSSG